MSARDPIVPAPGLYLDMPAEQYHATPAMSAGGLRLMRQSPAHFFGKQLDPRRPASEPTPAMKAGTMFHVALFEPHALAERYVVRPEGKAGDFRTTEGKAWRDANAGREFVEAADLAAANAKAAALLAIPEVAALLQEGHGEASAFWIDDETGELCKCRPDHVSPTGGGVILIDGKSCPDASPEGFGRTLWNMAYHLTAAWYTDGFERATGQRVQGYVFAAVEHEWPHAAAAYMLGDDVLDMARAENRRLLNRYAECRRTGQWPGYASGVNLINLPVWAQRELENA